MKNLTTKQIVEEFNLITGKSTKRFATRLHAEKALAKAREAKFGTETKSATKKSKKKVVTTKQIEEAMKKANIKPVVEKVAKTKQERSEAISESWNDKDVAAARSQRSHVTVAGVEYNSVASAFRDLELPMSKHIRFRGQLKAEGKLTFAHDGKKFNFKIVPSE